MIYPKYIKNLKNNWIESLLFLSSLIAAINRYYNLFIMGRKKKRGFFFLIFFLQICSVRVKAWKNVLGSWIYIEEMKEEREGGVGGKGSTDFWCNDAWEREAIGTWPVLVWLFKWHVGCSWPDWLGRWWDPILKSLYTESVSFPPCLGFGFAVFCLRLSLLSLTALVERRLVVFFDILMKLFRWCVGTTSVGTTSVGIVVSFYIITFPGFAT